MATTNATATSGFRLRRWQALTTPSCGRVAGMMLDGVRKFMNEASGHHFCDDSMSIFPRGPACARLACFDGSIYWHLTGSTCGRVRVRLRWVRSWRDRWPRAVPLARVFQTRRMLHHGCPCIGQSAAAASGLVGGHGFLHRRHAAQRRQRRLRHYPYLARLRHGELLVNLECLTPTVGANTRGNTCSSCRWRYKTLSDPHLLLGGNS